MRRVKAKDNKGKQYIAIIDFDTIEEVQNMADSLDGEIVTISINRTTYYIHNVIDEYLDEYEDCLTMDDDDGFTWYVGVVLT